MGLDPVSHKPTSENLDSESSKSSVLNHMAQWEYARLQAESRLAQECSKFVRHSANPIMEAEEEENQSSDLFLRAWKSEAGEAFRRPAVVSHNSYLGHLHSIGVDVRGFLHQTYDPSMITAASCGAAVFSNSNLLPNRHCSFDALSARLPVDDINVTRLVRVDQLSPTSPLSNSGDGSPAAVYRSPNPWPVAQRKSLSSENDVPFLTNNFHFDTNEREFHISENAPATGQAKMDALLVPIKVESDSVGTTETGELDELEPPLLPWSDELEMEHSTDRDLKLPHLKLEVEAGDGDVVSEAESSLKSCNDPGLPSIPSLVTPDQMFGDFGDGHDSTLSNWTDTPTGDGDYWGSLMRAAVAAPAQPNRPHPASSL